MVVIKLIGGLGNQMFQYAYGRYIAEINRTDLRLDIRSLTNTLTKEDHTKREYELEVFKLYSDNVRTFNPSILNKLINKAFRRKIIKEENFIFNKNYLNLRGNLYLDGYWQNEQYFIQIKEIIKSDFSFRKEAEGLNLMLLNSIHQSNSVSIHVRRGDYVSNAQAAKFHGMCDEQYYYTAIDLIRKKVNNPSFFVFSDDIQWVKDNITIEGDVTYIDHNTGHKSYEDMRLMSNCKHNIIANSSFSWWGAWLNNYGDKIVIAPKNWFLEEKTDIICDSWLAI